MNSLTDVDIHSVTGVLKLYLRELPEPLFTEANYSNFIDALSEFLFDFVGWSIHFFGCSLLLQLLGGVVRNYRKEGKHKNQSEKNSDK